MMQLYTIHSRRYTSMTSQCFPKTTTSTVRGSARAAARAAMATCKDSGYWNVIV